MLMNSAMVQRVGHIHDLDRYQEDVKSDLGQSQREDLIDPPQGKAPGLRNAQSLLLVGPRKKDLLHVLYLDHPKIIMRMIETGIYEAIDFEMANIKFS